MPGVKNVWEMQKHEDENEAQALDLSLEEKKICRT